MNRPVVIYNCYIATVNHDGDEHESGYIVVEDGRISAVGGGAAPGGIEGALWIDASGRIATPGFVNAHHHLYQWVTRGMAVDSTLFSWLVELYPVWAQIDEEIEYAAARAGLYALARSGCTTSMDHHYVFPRGAGDLLGAEIKAAREIGLRFHPARGSMDLGESEGGLPPDSVVENLDDILTASDEAIDRHHDPAPDSMLRVALAPCSPFSVTRGLMSESAELARKKGVRLHTHLAETPDEDDFCRERFGCRPTEYLEELGWTGADVWLAHCVHINADEARRFGRAGTGVAHCPSSNGRLGAGIAPVRELLDAGAPVGLGVDGAASNESGEIEPEIRQALLAARYRGGPTALSVREALAMATMRGARCLGRGAEIGSIEVGKQADIALWNLEEVGYAGIGDPVAALVLGPNRPVETLLVGGNFVVEDGNIRNITSSGEREIAGDLREASVRVLARSEEARV